jgi:integrase
MGKAEAVAKAEAKAALANHTFGAAADIWLAARKVGHSAKTYDRDERSVRYLKEGYRGAEGFGDLPVDQVGAKHLSAIAKKLNRPTRRRVVAAARKIMAVARSEEWITTSPFSDVDFNAGTAKHTERKRPAITDEAKFGELLRKIDGYAGSPIWYGLQLLALTFVRPGTVTKSRWKHFDLEKAQWVIPFEELKMEWLRTEQGEAVEDFTVPLSRQAVALLRKLHKISGASSGNGYLFPGPAGGETMDEQAMNDVLHSLGYKGIHCAHGFRSSASTILNRQRTPEKRRMFDPMLIELQLDHQDRSTRAIYDRDDCLPERIDLLQFWADKIDELRDRKAVSLVELAEAA